MDKDFILEQVKQRYREVVGLDIVDEYLADYIDNSVEGIYDTTIQHIGIDELNILNPKVESIETYFDIMDITDEQKEDRKALAYSLEDVMLFLFALIATYKDEPMDDWWLSAERAEAIAEDESNAVSNYSDYRKAIENGAKYKVWRTERDNRVRKTHRPLNGAKKPIKDPFLVGSSLMLFPKDTSYGASEREIVNCRCSIKYIR